MDVTWLGHGCFRLRGRSAAVVTDPFPPSIGIRLGKLEAQVVTISHDHPNHAYEPAVPNARYMIKGPGEYEVAGVGVTGFDTFHDDRQGAEHGRNTVYLIELDDVRVCHLGDLGHRLADGDLEVLGNVDVLLVPVGGRTTISAAQAAEVVRQIEPRAVVPMHFAIPGLKIQLDPVDRFLKEMSVAAADPLPKLSIQASASSGDSETKVVLLEPRA
jgi:L-ascorbate metabolism protein UlaG (beta-lactamase superfamily)